MQTTPFRILPEQYLHARRDVPLTQKEIEAILARTDREILPVAGDCLEALGVQDGGWVAVDFTRRPSPPRHKRRGGDGSVDICLCYATFPGRKQPAVMCKAYDGVWGPWQMVGTRYGDGRQNCAMAAARIFGVVFASWGRDGALLWGRDLESFPEKLGEAPTIQGDVEPVTEGVRLW